MTRAVITLARLDIGSAQNERIGLVQPRGDLLACPDMIAESAAWCSQL